MILKDRYLIEQELGRGGISIVYLARDQQLLSRPVVVKVLLAGVEESEQYIWLKKKFQQEIEALTRLNHPGIVGVFDAGEMPDGKPYLVMQFIEGRNLRSALQPQGLPLARVARLMRQIGQALSAAHERGVYHRDLKPENIMLQPLSEGEELVKLIDFGIARVKDSHVAASSEVTRIAGTPAYMAPEQLTGKASAASDIYALGVIAYEMVTGQRPFNEQSAALLYQVQQAGVKIKPRDLRPDLPEAAQRAILKALSFNPVDRHRRARELGDELAQALTAGPESVAQASMVKTANAVSGDGQLMKSASTSATSSQSSTPQKSLESVGGAVALNSEFYIVRSTDEAFQSAIARQDSIVLVKGARQMGKTSLLARGLQQARVAGAKVVLTDLQTLNAAQLESVETFMLTLAELIAEQLDLDVLPDQVWHPRRGPSLNFGRYIRREVLDKLSQPIVWGLDEVDRLFAYDFGNEVFGLFRSWHNARSLDPEGPWQRLTLAMAYATEAHLFITDLNQSPFNVGTRLALADFTLEQVAELNRRYGSPLRDEAEVERYFQLVGGQPYLVRCGLHEMATQERGLADFMARAASDEGPFSDHLRRMLVSLTQDAALCAEAQAVLQGRPCATAENFYRLRSAGVMSGDAASEARLRCRLYATYLEQHLL